MIFTRRAGSWINEAAGFCECRWEPVGRDFSSFTQSGGQMVPADAAARKSRSEEHTSELQSRFDLVCRLLLEKKNLHPQSVSVRRHDLGDDVCPAWAGWHRVDRADHGPRILRRAAGKTGSHQVDDLRFYQQRA